MRFENKSPCSRNCIDECLCERRPVTRLRIETGMRHQCHNHRCTFHASNFEGHIIIWQWWRIPWAHPFHGSTMSAMQTCRLSRSTLAPRATALSPNTVTGQSWFVALNMDPAKKCSPSTRSLFQSRNSRIRNSSFKSKNWIASRLVNSKSSARA